MGKYDSFQTSNRPIAALRSNRYGQLHSYNIGNPKIHHSNLHYSYPARNARRTFSAVMGKS